MPQRRTARDTGRAPRGTARARLALVLADRAEAGRRPRRRGPLRRDRRRSARRRPGSRPRRSAPRVPRGSACRSPSGRASVVRRRAQLVRRPRRRAARDARASMPRCGPKNLYGEHARMSASSACEVERAVLREVHAVDGGERADGVDAPHELGGRRDRAHRVRRERERDQPGPVVERGVERVQVERHVVVADVDPAHGGAGVLAPPGPTDGRSRRGRAS